MGVAERLPGLTKEEAREAMRLALIRARGHAGYKERAEFARLLGIDPSTYNRYENGDIKDIPGAVVYLAAHSVGVTMSQLMEAKPPTEELRSEILGRLVRVEKRLDGVLEGLLEMKGSNQPASKAGRKRAG